MERQAVFPAAFSAPSTGSTIQPYTMVFPAADSRAWGRENTLAKSSMTPVPVQRTMPRAAGAKAVAMAAIGSSGV